MKASLLLTKLRHTFVEPNVAGEDDRRRAYILNILLTGTIVLAIFAFLSSAVSKMTRATSYETAPLAAMGAITIFFIGLLYVSKRGYYRLAATIYITFFFIIATYPIVRWGILLPQGILTYCLIIVVSGVLLEARAAFVATFAATSSLLIIEHLNSVEKIRFDTAWMTTTGGYNDVVVYAITFSLVALVSWLSNKQIQQSLTRARRSERALRLERNLLEVRVRERTKELERAQVEKIEELNRFAEFGRISSTLLHELANPLTSAALNLELIKGKRSSELYDQLHESISFMEQYVHSARRQLRRESEVSDFNVAQEIERVVGFMQPKAKAMQIDVVTSLDQHLVLNGDSVKFNQIISNLLANSIDAYESLLAKANQPINISAYKKGKILHIMVQDYGMGIPRKLINHIFDPFYTTKLASRGTGLGLTITKRTIEEDFGGTIAATSTKQRGTCFSIRIPLA